MRNQPGVLEIFPMTDSKSYPTFISTLAISVVVLLAAFAAMVIAGEMGWINAEPARRGAASAP